MSLEGEEMKLCIEAFSDEDAGFVHDLESLFGNERDIKCYVREILSSIGIGIKDITSHLCYQRSLGAFRDEVSTSFTILIGSGYFSIIKPRKIKKLRFSKYTENVWLCHSAIGVFTIEDLRNGYGFRCVFGEFINTESTSLEQAIEFCQQFYEININSLFE